MKVAHALDHHSSSQNAVQQWQTVHISNDFTGTCYAFKVRERVSMLSCFCKL